MLFKNNSHLLLTKHKENYGLKLFVFSLILHLQCNNTYENTDGGKTSHCCAPEELTFIKQNSTWQRVYDFSLAKAVSQIQLCSRISIRIMKNLFKVVLSFIINQKIKVPINWQVRIKYIFNEHKTLEDKRYDLCSSMMNHFLKKPLLAFLESLLKMRC